jgi:biopolymer transport protein ExbD/biopolymer transport protein TolR
MGMSLGGGGKKAKISPDMNVTPLVDVVLVLLIIFMVLAPVVASHFTVFLPPKPDEKDVQIQKNQGDQPLVMTVTPDGTYMLNAVEVEAAELGKRVNTALNAQYQKLKTNAVYVNGADAAPYGKVLLGVDEARTGGASPVVILTKYMEPPAAKPGS